MKISKQEEAVLAQLKALEDKDWKTIKRELARDNEFMKNHVITKSALVREVTGLLVQKDKLKQEIRELQDKKKHVMIKDMVEYEQTEITNEKKIRNAHVKHLYRILNYLQENQGSYVTAIKNDCMMKGEHVKECLHFLIKFEMVREERTHNGGTLYYANDEKIKNNDAF